MGAGAVGACVACTVVVVARATDRVATMERFEHYVSMTVHGNRVGPVQLRGPYVDAVFAAQARP
ncbi:hypothetical protein GCM10011579_008550 [Streptomyces albiflavescens]|uniref:Uncharacterized protein n=1 Tax=Streptomyces albiflavescens TaxID=1623582 RepID=A0A917XUB9_9ACTN|nr:hypothetical protein GCM10011579_008550 [Streptomyces albiflavescens]